MLSTDSTRAHYDRRAGDLFKKYGGGDWPSAVLPNAFNDTLTFGGFGYGKVIVDEQGIVRSVNEFDTEAAIGKLFRLGYSDAKTAAESKKRGEYWHNNRSWRYFEEPEDNTDSIDKIAASDIEAFRNSKITINDETHSIDSAEYERNSRGLKLKLHFNNGDQLRLTITEQNLGSEAAKAQTMYYKNSATSGKAKRKFSGAGNLSVTLAEDGGIQIVGQVVKGSSKNKPTLVKANFHESIFGLGDSQLKVDGDQATLAGTLGTMTYGQIKDLIAKHPNVKTITLLTVDGSVNDEVNMHTGRLIREAGIHTRLLANSEVASGGVDLFCAGSKRTIEDGATIGVHSWSDEVFDGADYPDDHPAHELQMKYFKTMLGKELGPKFYLYTLKAASANDIHKMSKEEIKQWQLAN